MDDVREEMNSRLPTVQKEEVIGEFERVLIFEFAEAACNFFSDVWHAGEATVMEVFLITEGKKKKIPVAGSKCTNGELKISSLYKVLRSGEEIYRGIVVRIEIGYA